MTRKQTMFKVAVLASAMLGSAGAMADMANVTSGNSSLAFLALDATGTPASLMVDLGYNLTDFTSSAAINAPGHTVVWDFNNNSLTVDGTAKAGDYQWSSQYALFQAAAQAPETGYAVIAGDNLNFPQTYLTTGSPTATQLATQLLGNIGNMGVVNTLYASNNSLGTHAGTGVEGASAVINNTLAAAGYVGSTGNFGAAGNWKSNLAWNAFAPEGAAPTGLYELVEDPAAANKLGNFTYAAGVLTYATAPTSPVPEADGVVMALAGMSILGFIGRRRRDDR